MRDKSLKSWAIFFGIVAYIVAVVFGDIMFLQVVHNIFPTGLIGTFATIGALVTAFSSIALLLAIHFWVSPGPQYHIAITYWAFTVLILALNSMLAFELQMGGNMMNFWRSFSPATPILSVLGWGLILLADPSHQKRHAEMEFARQAQDDFLVQLREQRNSTAVLKIVENAAIKQAEQIADSILNGNGTKPKPALPKPTTTFGMEVDAPKVSARKGRA